MIALFRKEYPDQWEQLAQACKERANWTCEHCGIYSPPDNPAIRHGQKTGYPYFVYLHAAHKNHDKQNPNPVLICLCVSCHARYDYEHRERQARVRLECLKHLKLLIERGIVTARFFEA